MTVSSAQNKPAERRPKGRIRRRNEDVILRAAEEVFARAGFAGARVADIAAKAGVPQANLHYYFKSKRALYRAVIDNILRLWLAETDIIREDVEPRIALEQYLRAKMRFSRLYPNASKVFANEIIHGAGEIGSFLKTDLRHLVNTKARVFEHWMRAGRMMPLDPRHLFFAIWAITQTYADFEAQVRAVLGVSALSDVQFRRATEQVIGLILRGCGFYYAAPAETDGALTQS
ncbi:MAG: TetR family transcriptional regulator C-terminal domain-containing protein [Rhodospirillaceae bacterium]|nr:TetR family transcriptional regulator C-terminal domain-containing protein [Rhodospirillaceae bacterium]